MANIDDLLKEQKYTNELLKQLITIEAELLNFWFALKEEEFGEGDGSLNPSYLQEMNDEGFAPPEG